MCYFVTSNHTYSGCALQHTRSRPDTVPEAGAGPESTPVPSSFARLARYFHSSRTEADPAEGGPSNNLASTELTDEDFHCITRKTIIQCSKARNPSRGSDLLETPQNKRVCADAKEVEELAASPGEGESEDDGKLTSTKKGTCPVCIAMQEAVAAKSVIEVIVSDFC